MLFLHETHKIKGRCEDAFEDAIRDGWMARLAEGDSARLLWYANHAHGSGSSYQVVTVTGIADGAWEELARRIQSGDLQKFMRELDELRHDVEGKLLLPVYWSPLQSVDLTTVPIGMLLVICVIFVVRIILLENMPSDNLPVKL